MSEKNFITVGSYKRAHPKRKFADGGVSASGRPDRSAGCAVADDDSGSKLQAIRDILGEVPKRFGDGGLNDEEDAAEQKRKAATAVAPVSATSMPAGPTKARGSNSPGPAPAISWRDIARNAMANSSGSSGTNQAANVVGSLLGGYLKKRRTDAQNAQTTEDVKNLPTNPTTIDKMPPIPGQGTPSGVPGMDSPELPPEPQLPPPPRNPTGYPGDIYGGGGGGTEPPPPTGGGGGGGGGSDRGSGGGNKTFPGYAGDDDEDLGYVEEEDLGYVPEVARRAYARGGEVGPSSNRQPRRPRPMRPGTPSGAGPAAGRFGPPPVDATEGPQPLGPMAGAAPGSRTVGERFNPPPGAYQPPPGSGVTFPQSGGGSLYMDRGQATFNPPPGGPPPGASGMGPMAGPPPGGPPPGASSMGPSQGPPNAAIQAAISRMQQGQQGPPPDGPMAGPPPGGPPPGASGMGPMAGAAPGSLNPFSSFAGQASAGPPPGGPPPGGPTPQQIDSMRGLGIAPSSGPPPGPPPGGPTPQQIDSMKGLGIAPPGPPSGPPPSAMGATAGPTAGPLQDAPDPRIAAWHQSHPGMNAPGRELSAMATGGMVEDTEGQSPRVKGTRERQWGDVGKPAEDLPPAVEKKAKGGVIKRRPTSKKKAAKGEKLVVPTVTDEDMGAPPVRPAVDTVPAVALATPAPAVPPPVPAMAKGGACVEMAKGGAAKVRRGFPKVKKMATGGGVRGCGAANKGKGFSGVF